MPINIFSPAFSHCKIAVEIKSIKVFKILTFSLQDGETPLLWAARNSRGEIVANLLEKGAEVDARDEVRIDMYVGPMYTQTWSIVCHPTEFHQT